MAKKKDLASQIADAAKSAAQNAIKNAGSTAQTTTKIADAAKTTQAGKSKAGGTKTGSAALKKSTSKKKDTNEESLRKTWMEKAQELYKNRNSDARYDRNYFENYYSTPEGNALFAATKETATPMQAAQEVANYIKLQSGEDYRAAREAGYAVTAGKEQYDANDAINKNTYLTEVDSWMQLTKASEEEVNEILAYWKQELDDQTDNSKTKARLQERYDELYNWAGNTYSGFAGREYTDYYNRYARKKQELQTLGTYNSGVNEDEKATAQSALEWMSTGGDPVAIVENDETLRRLTDYDALERKYTDPLERSDAIMRSLIDYANKTGTSDFEREQQEMTLQAEADEIKAKMEEAKERKDTLEKKENYRKLLDQAWTKNAASGYEVPAYAYKSEYENEYGNTQYTINEPTLAQIMADPEGVAEEWSKTRASAGEVGAGNAVNLINRVKLMTPEERQLYKALYAEEGEEAAQEYFDSLTQSDLLAREMQQIMEKAAEFQDQAPVMANIMSLGTNLLGTVGRTAAWLKGEDQNSAENQFGAYTDTIRQNTREDIDSPVGRFLYDVGMGAADNLVAGAVGGQYAEWIQALGALGSGYMESMEQTGGDVSKARLTGAFEGLWEYATEKISWGALENTGTVNDIADATEYILKNMATEGLEEGVGGLLGDISGALIEGDDNEILQRIKYYHDNGYGAEETAKIVVAEQLKAIGYKMLVGSATGGMLSIGNVAGSLSMQNEADIATGRQIEQQGNISEVLKAGMESQDRSVRKISERLLEKLNLTDESQAVLPNDVETSAELQFVREGLSEEQKATTEAKQRENNEKRTEETMREPAQQKAAEGLSEEQKAEIADQQRENNEKRTEETMREPAQQTEGLTEEQKAEIADQQRENNEKRIEERTQEPARELSRKEARQLGKVYNKVLSAMDVKVEKNSKKLSKTLKDKLASYGESHIQEVTDAIAEVVTLGENASQEAVDIAEAAAMRDGAIKTVFDALKVDAARMREFVESTTADVRTRARSAAAATDGAQSEEMQITPAENGEAKQGSISYTTEAGDTYSGEIEGFDFDADGKAEAIIGGERVAVDNLVTENDDTGRLIDRAVALKDAKAAKLMYDSYEDGQNVRAYTLGFEAAYHYGEIGLDESRARRMTSARGVTDAQFTAAYEAGTAQAEARPQAVADRSGGRVSFADGLESRISELDSNQKGAIDAMTKMAELGTFNVEFFESQADESGSYMATENGSYDPSTNTMRFDINAGKNSESDIAEYAMLRTASHELTHYIKAQNRTGYTALLNYMVDNFYDGNWNSFDALVEEKMEQQKLSYADAAEEVVANGSEMMLKDSTAIQRLATQNRSLFSKVRSWVKSFVKSVKRAFQGVSAQSMEARLLKNAEEIQKKWDDALVGAMKNVREGGTQSENANAEANAANAEASNETQIKYSQRDAADDSKYIKEAERFFGTTTDFREAGYLLTDGKMLNFSGVHEGGTERGVRYVDHRDIWDVRASDDFSGTEAMVDFMNMGNIRLMDESGGINLQQAPTKAQETVLKRYVSEHNGYVIVDVDDASGKTIHSFEYDRGTSGTRVINDIQAYFADGTIPKKQSGIGNFLYGDVKYSKRSGIEFMEDKYFARLVDQIEEQNADRNIKVGSIEKNSVLNQVGLPATGLYFDVSKINRQLENHSDHITKDTIKSIPAILRDPIVIAEAKADTISVFGEAVVGDSPVMVGIVVTTDRRGHNLINKVRTIHARRNFAQQIVDENILYLNENKKRTRDWFKARDINVPLGGTEFGFIRSIAQDGESVKYSERTDGLSDREILAQAFESVAANDAEREMLTKYQSEIETLNAKQVERKNVQEMIRYLRKNTQTKDSAYKQRMAELQSQERALAEQINAADKTLLKMEHAKPLQDVLAREAKQYATQKVKESQKRTRERREKTELRRKIRNLADDFDRKLLKPTAKNYVPKEMVRAVVAMRELVDVNARRTSEDAKAKIAQIEEVYKKFKEDPQFAYVYDQTIGDMLSKLKSEVETGTDIYKMNTATLDDVYTTMKAMRKQVSEAVKLKSRVLKAVKMTVDGREATVIDVGREMYRETMEAAPMLRGKLSDYLNWQLNPDEFFDRMGGYKKGSAWKAVGDSFVQATQRMMEIQRTAQEHFAEWTNSKEFDKLNSTKEKDLIDIGLRDEAGKTVKVTRGMMLEAYMHLSSDDNASGFMYGGFSVPNLKKYYAGKVGESYGTGSINTVGTSLEIARLEERLRDSKLTEAEQEKIMEQIDSARDRGLDRLSEMRENIEKQLTSWDKGLIKAIHEWNDGTSRDLINEVSEDLYGVKRASVKNYYPIHRDKAFINTDFASISRNMNLENWGSLKDRVPSRAPILLGDITYTMDNSINQMSRYVAYSRSQRDFNKLYNIRMPGMAGSVKKAVGVKFGSGTRNIGVSGEQYIENYIGSITGSRESESDFLKVIRRNLPRATMSANFRVGFSQFSAITKAAVEVGWDSLAKGMVKGGFKAVLSGREQAQIAKENVWYWSRRNGEGGEREFSDMKGGTDPISKAWNWVDDKTGGWLLNLNQKIDVATTAPMYYAAQEWVKKNTNAREGTADFKELVNQKYTDILRKTQAANTISEMNDLARGSRSGALSILTMYKSEAFANFNILYDSIVRYRKYKSDLQAGKNGVTKADVKQAKTRIANSITSVVIGSSLLNAVIKLGVNAIFSNMNAYRDDDDEVNMGSIAKEIGMEMLDDATSMAVFGGEFFDVAFSIIGGESYDAPSLAALDELTDIIKTAVNLATKDDADAEDYMKAAEDVVMGVGTVFGIPLENTKRQVKGAINSVQDIFNGEAFRFEASVERKNSTNYTRLLKATLEGDDAKYESVLAELAENGVDETKAQEGYRGKLKDAYEEGKVEKEKAQKLLTEYGGKDEDDAYWLVEQWEYEGEGSYSKYIDLRTALEENDRTSAAAAVEELLEHGVKDTSLASQISKLYNNGEATSILALQMRPGRLYTPSTKEGQEEKKDDFNDFFDALLAGEGVKEEVAKLRKAGYSTKNIMSALNGAFGNSTGRYATMMKYNPTEGKILEERILDAYVAIELNREQEREWIHENWTLSEEENED